MAQLEGQAAQRAACTAAVASCDESSGVSMRWADVVRGQPAKATVAQLVGQAAQRAALAAAAESCDDEDDAEDLLRLAMRRRGGMQWASALM